MATIAAIAMADVQDTERDIAQGNGTRTGKICTTISAISRVQRRKARPVILLDRPQAVVERITSLPTRVATFTAETIRADGSKEHRTVGKAVASSKANNKRNNAQVDHKASRLRNRPVSRHHDPARAAPPRTSN